MSARFNFPFWPAWIGTCLLVAGCGEGYQLVPVSGQITLDGKPVPQAQISFQPQGPGPGSYGRTDDDGRFTLKNVLDDRPGAVPGPQAVRITTGKQQQPDSDSTAVTGELAPAKFLDGSVTFDVPAQGTDAANFDLGNTGKP